jgi:hypothetical protein
MMYVIMVLSASQNAVLATNALLSLNVQLSAQRTQTVPLRNAAVRATALTKLCVKAIRDLTMSVTRVLSVKPGCAGMVIVPTQLRINTHTGFGLSS